MVRIALGGWKGKWQVKCHVLGFRVLGLGVLGFWGLRLRVVGFRVWDSGKSVALRDHRDIYGLSGDCAGSLARTIL